MQFNFRRRPEPSTEEKFQEGVDSEARTMQARCRRAIVGCWAFIKNILSSLITAIENTHSNLILVLGVIAIVTAICVMNWTPSQGHPLPSPAPADSSAITKADLRAIFEAIEETRHEAVTKLDRMNMSLQIQNERQLQQLALDWAKFKEEAAVNHSQLLEIQIKLENVAKQPRITNQTIKFLVCLYFNKSFFIHIKNGIMHTDQVSS